MNRNILYNALAVLFGISLIALFELGLRTLDVVPDDPLEDPYAGFQSLRPLFVLNQETGRYTVSRARRTFFLPQSFAAEKPARSYRIFVLGGSTVQGRPYATETAFAKWLEIALGAADPERNWEVINCGGVSYASYRLTPIMQELTQYQPDLFILYTGHNEFLEERSYSHLKQASSLTASAYGAVSSLKSYALLEKLLQGEAKQAEAKTVLPTEVEALLDYQGGLEAYQRDPAWRNGVIAHYASNIERMAAIASDAEVPLILVNPISNLSASPPFKSLPGDSDADEADYHYARGKDYLNSGLLAEAKHAFIQAKEHDIAPLRMLEPMHASLLSIAHREEIPLLDARKLIESRSEGGIPGDQWLVDHVHPSIAGHQLIGTALARKMAELKLIAIPPGWNERREQQFARHLASLDELYYLVGAARLKGLQRWAAGRSTRVRADR